MGDFLLIFFVLFVAIGILHTVVSGIAALYDLLTGSRAKDSDRNSLSTGTSPTPSAPIESARRSDQPARQNIPPIASPPQPKAALGQAGSFQFQLPAKTNLRIAKKDEEVEEVTFEGKAAQVLDLMLHSGQSLFITGKAGTGKSTLLRHFVATTQKRVAVLTPTGIAAINVRGQTIHSFFRFPSRLLVPMDIQRPRDPTLYQKLDALVIDEISMVRADLLEMTDLFLRKARGNDLPFGGVQMILFGDPYQLPPIVREQEARAYLQREYGGWFFFDAPSYQRARIAKVELDHIYRQRDPLFISALNQIRVGQQSVADLEYLNGRYDPQFRPEKEDGYFTLTTTNERVAQINRSRLNSISGPEQAYPAIIMGYFDCKAYPADMDLRLKVGAQVMLLRNDPGRRWVNGSIGWVTRLGPSAIEVRLANPRRNGEDTAEIKMDSWENIRYIYDPETNSILPEVIGSFSQFPVKLCWAMTIHKSQGQTFDRVMIDMDRGAFADGQTYVALSRCRSLDGIVLTTPIRPSDVRVGLRVHEFMGG